jgi:hypothetical protein
MIGDEQKWRLVCREAERKEEKSWLCQVSQLVQQTHERLLSF